jgi:hypothetical protein
VAIVKDQDTTTATQQPVGPKLTTRRKILLSSLVNGKSMAEATGAAGMVLQSGYRAMDEMKDRLPELMRRHGLGEDQIIGRLRDKMDATKTVTASMFGVITDSMEIADNPVQMKAIELAADLMGMTNSDAGRGGIGTVNIVWNGIAPPWAQPTPLPIDHSNELVIDGEGYTHPEVQLKVLGRTPALPPPTHPEGSLSERVMSPKRTRKARLPRGPK